MARGIAWAGVAASVIALCLAGSADAAHSASTCSVQGLAVSSVHVIGLRVEGLSCVSARTVAGRVAADLAHNRSISISGSVGFGMSTSMCTGCKTTTTVTITYPHASLAISLRGGSGSAAPSTPIPSFGSSPGGGTVI
jgi:hypothetical protein